MDVNTHVLIAGAGIGGLTSALALAQNGFQVSLFEKAANLGDIGAGIQISPNAMQVLDALGLGDDITALACEPNKTTFRDYKTGRIDLAVPLKPICRKRYGQPYFHIHRADLHDILTNAVKAAGIDIHLNVEACGLFQSDTGVSLLTSQDKYHGNFLIGADGIHSSIQTAIGIKQPPGFTGQTAWRGLVPATDALRKLIPFDATVWMGPGQHFVTYYVRGGELINFVAVQEREVWTQEGWNLEGDMQDLRQAFTGWDVPVTSLLQACQTCHYWGLFDRPTLTTWTDGRVALLGDACHPMLPFMAQGAASAIEDAWVMSQALTKDQKAQALKRYEAQRKPRTNRIQALSRRNATLYHLDKGWQKGWRTFKFGVATAIPPLAYSQLDPIYGGFKL